MNYSGSQLRKLIVIVLLSLTCISCQSRLAQTTVDSAPLPSSSGVMQQANIVVSERTVDELVESFSDDSNIGMPRKNKIEINNFERSQGGRVVIKFYSLTDRKEWNLKQEFEFEKDSLTGIDPVIDDFNNDGLRDITYVSNVAARGANEVRTLFIYDKERDELIHIKNSEHYPNMLYNKKLDCIDAWLFHGATTTVFLRIEGDILREFASVNTGSELVVTVVQKDGKELVLRREKMKDEDIYTRFINFDPPEPYEVED